MVRGQQPRPARQRLSSATPTRGCSPVPETGRLEPREKELPAQVPKVSRTCQTWVPTWKLGDVTPFPSLVGMVGRGLVHRGCQCNGSHQVPSSRQGQSQCRPALAPHPPPPTQGAPSQPRGLAGGPPWEACTLGPPAPCPQHQGGTPHVGAGTPWPLRQQDTSFIRNPGPQACGPSLPPASPHPGRD